MQAVRECCDGQHMFQGFSWKKEQGWRKGNTLTGDTTTAGMKPQGPEFSHSDVTGGTGGTGKAVNSLRGGDEWGKSSQARHRKSGPTIARGDEWGSSSQVTEIPKYHCEERWAQSAAGDALAATVAMSVTRSAWRSRETLRAKCQRHQHWARRRPVLERRSRYGRSEQTDPIEIEPKVQTSRAE